VTGTTLSQRDERGAPAVLRIGPQSFVLFAMKTLQKNKKSQTGERHSQQTSRRRGLGVGETFPVYLVDRNLSGRGSFGGVYERAGALKNMKALGGGEERQAYVWLTPNHHPTAFRLRCCISPTDLYAVWLRIWMLASRPCGMPRRTAQLAGK